MQNPLFFSGVCAGGQGASLAGLIAGAVVAMRHLKTMSGASGLDLAETLQVSFVGGEDPVVVGDQDGRCLLYTSPSPRDRG